ncbi:MAG: DUF192 domain-containing protein [Leptospiraceae bacterium]|nr:DUF192 domain-containing protein [Leptospiraceae bacterium]MDW8307602.1 DUF192 domain-containing protein [Leptospiraceae bacterium]
MGVIQRLIVPLWLLVGQCSAHYEYVELRGEKSYRLKCELADTPEKRARGLMFRKTLEPDGCMLFVFPSEEILYFWMKNTYIPLSIAFANKEGVITTIKDMKPLEETPVSSEKPAKYALEMNYNWFFKHRIKTGDYLIFLK